MARPAQPPTAPAAHQAKTKKAQLHAEQRSAGRVLLSAEELGIEFGLRYSKVQLWKLVRAGLFPAPIKISSNRNAWIRDEIVAWVEARMAERPPQPTVA